MLKKKYIALLILVPSIVIVGIALGVYYGVYHKNNGNGNGNGDGGDSKGRMIGYYQETATNNKCPGITEMTVDKIPKQYYTHLIYGFAPPITPNGEFGSIFDDEKERYSKITSLGLHVSLSIGGDLASIKPMSDMVANKDTRKHFCDYAVNYAKSYGFKGIDIDWEYPGDIERGGSTDDSKNFIEFVKDLRESINKIDSTFTLSVALAGGPFWGKGYSVNDTIDYVDWFNIMSYNVAGRWNGVTNCQSPLNNKNDSVTKAVEYFTNGHPLDKFNLGMSFFGTTFTLPKDTENTANTLYSPISNATSTPGKCTKQTGYLSYFEILDLKKDNNVFYSEDGSCHYFVYNKNQWVGYDELEDYKKRISSFNLGGIVIWGMDADHPDDYPLTKGIHDR